MKLLILIIPFLILSCGSDVESQKQKRAQALFDRICAIVHNSSSNSFTAEWDAMAQKIYDGRDTVFLTDNDDFKIVVTVRHAIVSDTTPIPKPGQPPDTSKNTWR